MAVYRGWRYIEDDSISRVAVYRGWRYIETGGISREERSKKNQQEEIGTSQKLAVYRVWHFVVGRYIEVGTSRFQCTSMPTDERWRSTRHLVIEHGTNDGSLHSCFAKLWFYHWPIGDTVTTFPTRGDQCFRLRNSDSVYLGSWSYLPYYSQGSGFRTNLDQTFLQIQIWIKQYYQEKIRLSIFIRKIYTVFFSKKPPTSKNLYKKSIKKCWNSIIMYRSSHLWPILEIEVFSSATKEWRHESRSYRGYLAPWLSRSPISAGRMQLALPAPSCPRSFRSWFRSVASSVSHSSVQAVLRNNYCLVEWGDGDFVSHRINVVLFGFIQVHQFLKRRSQTEC